MLSKQHYYLLRCRCCFQTDIQLLNITLKFSVLLLLCKLLGLLCVITGRSDAEPDEPHHSVSYFCQMSLPNISALFHAVAHKYSDTLICLFFCRVLIVVSRLVGL